MVLQESLFVTLVKLVDRIPTPSPPPKRGRGRPKYYPDRLFLKALVIMIVRHLHKVHELLSMLDQPTAEMKALRGLDLRVGLEAFLKAARRIMTGPHLSSGEYICES